MVLLEGVQPGIALEVCAKKKKEDLAHPCAWQLEESPLMQRGIYRGACVLAVREQLHPEPEPGTEADQGAGPCAEP